MSHQHIKKNLVRNTLSNYVKTIVAMAVGLVTFRLLYQHFSREEFGFWSLLWSVFGFGILLDFGFGFAAQKRVAELSVKQDWEELSRVLSSILIFYFGIALVLSAGAYCGSPWLIKFFKVSAARSEEFRIAMVVFFAGIGLSFPLGIFPEILRGQQRISLTNWLVTTAIVLRLVFVIAAIYFHWSFLVIMIIALGSALVPDAVAAFFALKQMPQVKLRPSRFSFHSMRDTARFSFFAYLGTATNLVLAKTDQLVITTALGVSAIALYQAGAKVGEMFRDFTKQVQDALSPAAAHLHASGQHQALRDLLIQGTRWSVMIATPLYLLCAFYLDELLLLLTGDHHLSPETWWVGQTLMFWYYTSILTHSVSKRVFMMTGHERRLMWLGVGEAATNLIISIGLVIWFRNVTAVAVGSLVPTLWFGWLQLWPWMAQEAGESTLSLFKKAVLPSWIATSPALVVLVALKFTVLAPAGLPLLAMVIEGAVCGAISLAGIWRFGLKDHERAALASRMRSRTQIRVQPV